MRRTNGIRDRKQDFVRGEIWNAAVTLFASRGYDATTVEDIAAAAGVSRRTFFRYFASKDDLMVKAMDSYGDLLSEGIRSAAPDDPPLQILRQAVVRVANAVLAQPRVREMMAISLGSPAARRAQLGELEILTDRIAGEFARVLRRHPRRRCTARLMASLTIAVLTQTFRAWYARPATNIEATVAETLDALNDIAGTGVRASPTRRRA